MRRLVCEECGWDGEGGAVEYPDGTYHFRANIVKGVPQPIMCKGKLRPLPGKRGKALREGK